MTTNLIAKSSGVVVEGLFIPDMVKKRRFAKGIYDAAWGEMRRQLEYKCKWNHKPFIILDRYEPTTKTCSCCGSIQKMPVHVRVYKCQECGFELCRDKNAAINILNKGIEILNLNTVGITGIQACGAAFSKKWL